MARIFQEGFEGEVPNNIYVEGSPDSQLLNGLGTAPFPTYCTLANGRNAISQRGLRIKWGSSSADIFRSAAIRELDTPISELYFRVYLKANNVSLAGSGSFIVIRDGNDLLMDIYQPIQGGTTLQLYVRIGGTRTFIGNLTISEGVYHKVEMYLKLNATTGAYELRLDNNTKYFASGLNTGTNLITNVGLLWDKYSSGWFKSGDYTIDDMAINDTTGSLNNSWCGDGSIIALKPKGTGNYSQWDTCEGYCYAESGTNTTTVKITGHGLSTGDVIFNKTQNEYRTVTVTDANTLTVASITNQTDSDIILMYTYQDTIINTIPTVSADEQRCLLAGHNLKSGDVIMNVTVSNTIKPVVFTAGDYVWIFHDNGMLGASYDIGSVISAMANGNSIKTFKFKPKSIASHWLALNHTEQPSPKMAYIKTNTSGDIDTYDMEELVADKGLASGTSIVSVSHCVLATEAGGGSKYKPVFRIGAVDYEGVTKTLVSGTQQYQAIYEVSPATSVAWTRAEIDALEAGIKAI